jgi:hypothetical protein
MGSGAVRELVRPFLTLTVLAGAVGAVVAAAESIRCGLRQPRIPQDLFDERQRNRRNRRVAIVVALANMFPLFVHGLSELRGVRLFD